MENHDAFLEERLVVVDVPDTAENRQFFHVAKALSERGTSLWYDYFQVVSR